MDNSDLGIIFQALSFAAEKHRDQRRKGAEASPYINHPIALVNVLVNEGGVEDTDVICAAILHDTVEDTETSEAELRAHFGNEITDMVMEVTDDKSLRREARKRLQIEHAPVLTDGAKLVKLADKICNLRDTIHHPPANWDVPRKQEYFTWAKLVINGVRGVSPDLEAVFDAVYERRE